MDRKSAIILLAFLATASAIVCRPDICSNVRCMTETKKTCEAKGQEYRPNSTLCGCCDRCVPYIEDGESCGRRKKSPIKGGPPVIIPNCRPGHSCIEGVCKPVCHTKCHS